MRSPAFVLIWAAHPQLRAHGKWLAARVVGRIPIASPASIRRASICLEWQPDSRGAPVVAVGGDGQHPEFRVSVVLETGSLQNASILPSGDHTGPLATQAGCSHHRSRRRAATHTSRSALETSRRSLGTRNVHVGQPLPSGEKLARCSLASGSSCCISRRSVPGTPAAPAL